MRAFLALASILACGLALASTYTRDGGTADHMCCADKACTTIISQHADPVRARDACGVLTDQDRVRRWTRSQAFRIDPSGTAPPPQTCPPKPADDTRIAQCPAGTTGNWQQTQSYGSVAYPTCWVPSGFIPSAAPEGACVTTPPATTPLTAPTLATPTHVPHPTTADRYNVILSWSAVPGADAYRIRRCVGPNCSTMSVIAASVPGTTHTDIGVSPNTVKYQVDARRGTSEIGPASPLMVYVVTATPPPPGSGVAKLTWTAPTANADSSPLTNLAGFRVVYGTSADALGRSIQLNSASARTYTVEGLAPGTWYFAIYAYDSTGAESQQTNAASKVVP
jgi:hypothetical protein